MDCIIILTFRAVQLGYNSKIDMAYHNSYQTSSQMQAQMPPQAPLPQMPTQAPLPRMPRQARTQAPPGSTISTQGAAIKYTIIAPSKVLVFSEKAKGWTSFRSHTQMQNALSMGNNYYTFNNGNLYIHYSEDQDRNTFYNTYHESTINVILNDQPGLVKMFNTLNYEGSQSRIKQFVSQTLTLPFQKRTTYSDQEIYNLSDKDGWYVCSIFTDMEEGSVYEFLNHENKWFNNVNRLIDINLSEADTSDFTFQGLGTVEK
jgi:hypothetical protein